jgi:hypothetical protein
LGRLADTVVRVLRQSGFTTKSEKLVYYGPAHGVGERIITGVSVRGGRISAPLDYVKALERELKRAIKQSKHSVVTDEFQPREHYRGKIAYVRWLDPELGQRLLRLYRKVKWRHFEWAVSRREREMGYWTLSEVRRSKKGDTRELIGDSEEVDCRF